MDCRKGSVIIIQQIREILSRMTDAQYVMALPLYNGSTIGQHMRHIYDFYNSVISASELGELDYAKRDRNPDIESYTHSASTHFKQMIDAIQLLSEDLSIDVVTEFDTQESTLRKRVKSSVGRELMYAYDHAVHHMAIVKMGLQTSFPEFDIDKNIGVAPSTIKHNSLQSS